ncbi:MAG: hypothetical protein ACREM1_16885 [Longimicrobiales bacterium]
MKRVLAEVLEIDDLGRNQGYGEMLAAIIAVWPMEVVDFLVERMTREHHSFARGGQEYIEYDAIPYHGWHEVAAALQRSPKYRDIVRRMRDALLTDDVVLRRAIHDFMRQIAGWNDETEAAYREWFQPPNCAGISALGGVNRLTASRARYPAPLPDQVSVAPVTAEPWAEAQG